MRDYSKYVVFFQLASRFSIAGVLFYADLANSLTGGSQSETSYQNEPQDPLYPKDLEPSLHQIMNLTLSLDNGPEDLVLSPIFSGGPPRTLGLMALVQEYEDLISGKLDIKSLLRRKTSSSLNREPLNVTALNLDSTGSGTYRFAIGEIPICGYNVKYQRLHDGQVSVIGKIPRISKELNLSTDWPSAQDAFDVAKNYIESYQGGRVEEIPVTADRCFFVDHGSASPAWKLVVKQLIETEEGDYIRLESLIVDDNRVYQRHGLEFDVTGKVRFYPFNFIKTPTPVQENIENLTGDGTLSSDILTSSVMSPYKRVQSSNHEFLYDPNSSDFGEVSAFVHASKHLKYLQMTGFQWYGLKPLKLTVFASTLRNNARFVPQISETIPGQIDIGTSDGKILRNLELDSDVVSHEVGHFVIYKSVKSTSGESLVLHEGLADYFAFARSNDPCLGESICPDGSTACIKPGQCLRSAENSIKVNDSLWSQWFDIRKSLNHLHGQVISGMLWDLRDKGIPAKSLDQMVMSSISSLPEDADFSHFLLALATADKALFDGVYLDRLRAAAEDRNLGNRFPAVSNGNLSKSTVADTSVTKEQLSGQSNAPTEGGEVTTTRTRGGSTGGLGCAVINQGKNRGVSDIFLLLLMLLGLPLALGLVSYKVELAFKREKTKRPKETGNNLQHFE